MNNDLHGVAAGGENTVRAGSGRGAAPSVEDGLSGARVFLETFGCQMNDNDSERILGFLACSEGAMRTASPDDADIIILNTCSIRDKAEQKVYSMLGRFKTLKAERPALLIGVGGCVGAQEGERLLKRVPYLDFVFGPHTLHLLPEIIGEVRKNHSRVAEVEFSDAILPGEYGVSVPVDGVKASVSIMRGCNNFCAYCIVPYTRGREVSRPAAEIVTEVGSLAGAGVREVMLLGQNVNSYGRTGAAPAGAEPFVSLLTDVCGVEGVKRVRFVTSHPKDISTALIRLFGAEEKLARHLHLPVQSGSDAVLARMGRGYTSAEYLEKVDLIQELYPEMALTSDIIVGFPGETDSDFDLTMELVSRVRFDNLFSFAYSSRPGTRAAELDEQLPASVSSARLAELQRLQREITAEKRAALVGRIVEVLIEGPSKQDEREISGRTPCNNVVNLPGPQDGAGEMMDVLITGALPNSLRGEPASTTATRSLSCS